MTLITLLIVLILKKEDINEDEIKVDILIKADDL